MIPYSEWILLCLLCLLSIIVLTRTCKTFNQKVLVVAIADALLYIVINTINNKFIFPWVNYYIYGHAINWYDVFGIMLFFSIGYILCVPVFILLNKVLIANNIQSLFVVSMLYLGFSLITSYWVYCVVLIE